MSDKFIEVYSKISKISHFWVRELLKLQDETDTAYSRVKTCLELWNHQQKEIDRLTERVKEIEAILKNTKEGLSYSSCSGCYETIDGHDTGYYPYDKLKGIHIGSGCNECDHNGYVLNDYSGLQEFYQDEVIPQLKSELQAERERNKPQWKSYHTYMVSDHGVIKNCHGKILDGSKDRGYRYVQLTMPGGGVKNKGIHRLVAELFVDGQTNINNAVNHKNGVRHDNTWYNLEWVDARENHEHSIKTNVAYPGGEKNNFSKLTDEQRGEAWEMIKSGNYTNKEIGDKFGVTGDMINKVRKGQCWRNFIINYEARARQQKKDRKEF